MPRPDDDPMTPFLADLSDLILDHGSELNADELFALSAVFMAIDEGQAEAAADALKPIVDRILGQPNAPIPSPSLN